MEAEWPFGLLTMVLLENQMAIHPVNHCLRHLTSFTAVKEVRLGYLVILLVPGGLPFPSLLQLRYVMTLSLGH